MHGKKRAEYKDRLNDPKTAAILGQKAQQWHALMKELHHRRRDAAGATDNAAGGGGGGCGTDDYDGATAQVTLSLLEKALMVNPDPLNLWNHRRQVLLQQQEFQGRSGSDNDNDDIKPSDKEGRGGGDDASSLLLLETELPLTHAALQRNPKAYGAWMHRKWVLSHVRPPPAVLEQELSLTSKFLSLDERNFHCWNYRRFIVGCLALATTIGNPPSSSKSATVDWTGSWMLDLSDAGDAEVLTTNSKKIQELMGPQLVPRRQKDSTIDDTDDGDITDAVIPMSLIQSEFDFTTTKIKDNFSNFSAFHYRCQLLDVLVTSIYSNKQHHQPDDQQEQERQRQHSLDDLIEQEFQLMEDAFCTEPDDQTAWWYHSIFLDKILETQQHQQHREVVDDIISVEWMTRQRLESRLNDQAELLRELLEESSNCKWVMLGLARVLEILIDYEHSNGDDQKASSEDEGVVMLKEERTSLLSRLIEIDPDRGQRYTSMMNEL